MQSSFEKEFLDLFYQKQKLLFESYTTNHDVDFSEVDNKIYNHLRCDAFDQHRILMRTYFDVTPECEKLVHKIDDLSNYDKEISDAAKNDRYQYKCEVASKMRSDVIKLMQVRNKNSMYMGWNSYLDLILATEGYRGFPLKKILRTFVEDNINEVRNIIKTNNIKWESWFNDLDSLVKTESTYNSDELINIFTNKLGLSISDEIKITFEGESIGSFCMKLPNSIEVVVNKRNSLRDIQTMFHELGHALYYSYIEGEGLENVLPPSLDEVLAVVFEYIATQMMFEGKERDALNQIMKLEYTRCALSALYEFDLWKKPEDAESLYTTYYSILDLEILNLELWSYDSFRSIDSAYIHNYTMGYIIAEKLFKKLGHDHLKLGTFLKGVMKKGSSITINELLELVDRD